MAGSFCNEESLLRNRATYMGIFAIVLFRFTPTCLLQGYRP